MYDVEMAVTKNSISESRQCQKNSISDTDSLCRDGTDTPIKP